jgi:hypothetical protein
MDAQHAVALSRTPQGGYSSRVHRTVLTRRRVTVAAVVVLLAFPVTSLWVRAAHPRDEADFLLAARTEAPVGGFSNEELVAEGDYACHWLDRQDRAWWNHGTWFDRAGVLDRYIEQTRPILRGQWGLPGRWEQSRRVVADAAWSQLCGGTWWWHRPHGPRGPRGGGTDGD